jgi:hypothetical protein
VNDPRTCPHEHSEPVEVRNHTTGAVETVARICTACVEQLPAAWGCTRCEWVEERRLCDPVDQLMLARPCQEHA